MGLFKNLTKTIGKIAPIAIPAMMGFGFGGGAAGGIGSFFSGLSGGSKLGLGLGALALAGGLGRRRWESFEHHDQSKLSGQANRSTKPSHRNYTRRIYRCPCCRLMDRTRKLLKIQS